MTTALPSIYKGTVYNGTAAGREYRALGDILSANRGVKEKGIVFINGSEDEKYVSYEELFENARRVWAYLRHFGVGPGNELVFQLDRNDDFIYVFWACILGGIIPVPVSVGNNDEHRLKLIRIWAQLNRPYLIASGDIFARLEKYARQDGRVGEIETIGRQTLFIETFKGGNPVLPLPGGPHPSAPDDIALIQFSSGSTGAPKGVTLTHKNILANTEALVERCRFTPSDSFLNWMPLSHDMGLIAFHLTALSAGMNQYVLHTGHFIRRPLSWLAKAAEYKVTLLSSPNFGFHYFLLHFRPGETRDWDLSRVRFILNGAEPISIELCRRFLKTLAPLGLKSTVMYTAYGLAEATVGVAVPREARELSPLYLDRRRLNMGQPVKPVPPGDKNCIAFADVGPPLNYCSLRIVDENNRPVEEAVVGQIQIKGRNVTTGYYNNIKATREAVSGDGWLNTGDLGFLHRGSLVVTGRLKDVIFVNGQNYYPHDLERLAEGLDGVGPGRVAACGIFDRASQKEEIYVFVVFRRKLEDFTPLAPAVKKYLNTQLGVVIRRVIPVKRMPRTTSGKIQRFKLRQMVENGLFRDVVKELDRLTRHGGEPGTGEVPADEIEAEIGARLIKLLEEIFPGEKITVTADLLESGIDSIRAVKLLYAIEEEFRVKLSITDILNHADTRALVRCICRGSGPDGIGRVPEREYYPVSSGQKRLYSLQQIPGTGSAYNETLVLEVRGDLDKNRLGRAFQKLIRHQESLRTSFFAVSGQVVQRVHAQLQVKIAYKEIGRRELDRAVRELGKPFHLDEAPLVRAGLFRVRDEENVHIFLVCMHHIIVDGWSADILIRQLTAFYEGRDLPAPALRYRDFSVWQNRRIEGGITGEVEEYWLGRFSGAIPVLNLAGDFPRPALQSFAGDRVYFRIGSGLTAKLDRFCAESGTTRYMLLLACLNVLLARYTGQEDMVIGSPVLGRPHAVLKDIIGMFVNNLAMRNFPSGGRSFGDFLQEVKRHCLEAYANQDYPFEVLVERLGLTRDTSRNPLFNVVFAWQNNEIRRVEIPGVSFTVRDVSNGTGKFDLVLFAWGLEEEGDIRFSAEYCSRLFRRRTIRRLTGHFRQLLRRVVEKPGQALFAVDILTGAEKHCLLHEFNGTDAPYPAAKTLHRLFEEQTGRTPDIVSLVGRSQYAANSENKDGRTLQLTYGELNKRSDQTAHTLREKGVQPDTVVGMLMERSIEMIIGILGILKSGGVYLPIDTRYPRERIDYMLKDSNAAFLLSDGIDTPRPLRGPPPQEGTAIAYRNPLPGLTGAPPGMPEGSSFHHSSNLNQFITHHSGCLAYVIYTSGSTGKPKGVLVNHRGVVNMVCFHRSVFGEDIGSRISQSAGVSFDAMVFETWPCLSAGGTLCIVDEEARPDPQKLKEWLILQQVTISFQPTWMARQLLQERWPEERISLRMLRTAGEKLDVYPARPYPFRFYNLYGPTEDTVWTTWTEVPPNPSGGDIPPCIGKPAANKQVYILNPHLKPQPIGAAGELCIAGDGLARGYLNRPELTAEKFIAPPQKTFNKEKKEKKGTVTKIQDYPDRKKKGTVTKITKIQDYPDKREHKNSVFSVAEKFYKTGDLARWLPDGSIEFLDRIDRQVKLRGYRIEPGEIEAVLNRHGAVSESAVVVKGDTAGDNKLIAYLVPVPGFGAEKPAGEGQEEQLSRWEMLFDENYDCGEAAKDDTFNIAGWNSSYTGEPIEPEAMREWVEATVERIRVFQPKRVYEIGAGTGLLLFRIAETCERYAASDFSAAAVRSLRQTLAKQERQWANTGHVNIFRQAADDFSNIGSKYYDLVIINSVVQYFPDPEYLQKVLHGALAAVKPGGAVFIGDVRNYVLFQTFHRSVQLHKAPSSMSIDALNREVQKSMAAEPELLVSPGFFTDLAGLFPGSGIAGVDILYKRSRFHNELTRYRYDAVIYVGLDPDPEPGAGGGGCRPCHPGVLAGGLPGYCRGRGDTVKIQTPCAGNTGGAQRAPGR